MQEQNTNEGQTAPEQNEPPKTTVQDVIDEQAQPKKVFNRNDVRRSVDVQVVFPRLYPDYEPWGFKMRLKLSREAEDRRQEYLSLSAVKQTEQMTQQALDEVCDLLVELPTGFDDLKDTGKGPGHSFRSYVETATDPDMKEFLAMLVEAADSAYWNAIAPREFRKQV